MRHTPHVVVGLPWPDGSLPLSILQWRHLTKVLRLGAGDQVTYTDGLGVIGRGRLAHHAIVRGEETTVPRPTELTVFVAPPANKDRQRYLVEKLAEIGVARLVWLETRQGKTRVASPPKVFSWVLAATEQSRGAWLMEVSDDVAVWGDVPQGAVVCDPSGARETPPARTVVIGPEGGWAADEVPSDAATWSLGDTILRVETAAVVAAARLLGAS